MPLMVEEIIDDDEDDVRRISGAVNIETLMQASRIAVKKESRVMSLVLWIQLKVGQSGLGGGLGRGVQGEAGLTYIQLCDLRGVCVCGSRV